MHRRSDVQVDPDPGPVEAYVRGNEKAGTGAGAVVPVLGGAEGQALTLPLSAWGMGSIKSTFGAASAWAAVDTPTPSGPTPPSSATASSGV